MQVDALLAVLRPQPGPHRDVLVGHPSPEIRRSTYGGLFVAQALLAAAATADADRVPHSLHGTFLRAGAADRATHYHVERVRDGRSYSHREVRAVQDGRECFRAIVSLQVPGSGADYAPPPAPAAPAPAEPADPAMLPSYVDWVRAGTDNPDHFWLANPGPVELRVAGDPPTTRGEPITEPLVVWARLRGAVTTGDPLLHRALLAWLSDKTLSDVLLLVHGRRWTDHGADSVSLDHALHLFGPVSADQWFRCTQYTIATAAGRGLARGTFHTADGILAAHASQEAVVSIAGA